MSFQSRASEINRLRNRLRNLCDMYLAEAWMADDDQVRFWGSVEEGLRVLDRAVQQWEASHPKLDGFEGDDDGDDDSSGSALVPPCIYVDASSGKRCGSRMHTTRDHERALTPWPSSI